MNLCFTILTNFNTLKKDLKKVHKSNQNNWRASLETYIIGLEEAKVSQDAEPNKQSPGSQ